MSRRQRQINFDKSQPVQCQINSWTSLEAYKDSTLVSLNRVRVKSRYQERLQRMLIDNARVASIIVDEEIEFPFLADVKVHNFTEDDLIEDLAAREEVTVIVMDQISDTRNFGAIARSAAFFGIPWIVVTQNRQAPITSATLATAQGAFAHVKVASVVNIARSLDRLKKEGGCWVIGTAMDGTSLNNRLPHYEKKAIVLGNESAGIRSLTAKKCDLLMSIPGGEASIDSLNVAVAAGVFMYALTGPSNNIEK